MAELEDGEDFDFRMGDMDLDWLDFTNSIIERADALGLRLRDNPTPEDIEEAKRFLGIEERGRFIQDPATGRFEGSEPGPGDGGGDGGGGKDGGRDEYGLRATERQQLHEWMGSGYREMRTDRGFIDTLQKLPNVTGVYYRGTRVTDQELAKLQSSVGGTTTLQKHSSSAVIKGASYGFMKSQRHDPEKKHPVMFVVRGSGFKIPRQLAQEAGSSESEVIIPMGERFKITGVEKTKDDDYGEYYVVHWSKV